MKAQKIWNQSKKPVLVSRVLEWPLIFLILSRGYSIIFRLKKKPRRTVRTRSEFTTGSGGSHWRRLFDPMFFRQMGRGSPHLRKSFCLLLSIAAPQAQRIHTNLPRKRWLVSFRYYGKGRFRSFSSFLLRKMSRIFSDKIFFFFLFPSRRVAPLRATRLLIWTRGFQPFTYMPIVH